MSDDVTNALEQVLDEIGFDDNGLIPAIAQQHDTGEVLMLAWMNRDAVTETLGTGDVHYFSRSRGELWRKGQRAGQTQKLGELRLEGDGDTLGRLVEQKGVAGHTGRRNCGVRGPGAGKLESIGEVEIDPKEQYPG